MAATILLAGAPFVPQEKQCSVAILPGYLVENTPGAATLRPHATADGGAAPSFALESLVPPPRGVTTAQIDTPYAIGDTIRWIHANPGDLLYAWVPANAAAIVEGDNLVSAGDGTLKLATAATAVTVGISRQIVAKAAEALNNSAVGTPARLRVRAL